LQLDGAGRLYQQVYRALRGEILSGRLASGERVPSTRHIASLLNISRNTAVMAYEQLLAEGFIQVRSGAAGTVVAPVLPPDGYVLRPMALPRSARPSPSGAPRRSSQLPERDF
jgi:GntR family transcriptional regulator / MocR family aminotransferase